MATIFYLFSSGKPELISIFLFLFQTIDKEIEFSKWEVQMTGQLPTMGLHRDPDVAPHPLQGLLVRGVHPGTSIM